MRAFIRIVENAGQVIPPLDREAIVRKMVDAYFDGHYWDDAALARHPGRSFDSDDTHEMHDTWTDEDDYPLRNLESSKAITRPEFRARLEQWARARLAEVEEKLQAVAMTNGLYRVHRVMRVPARWWSKVRKAGHTTLGVHWTYSLEDWDAEIGAHPVWAPDDMKGVDITIEAMVAPADVDWPYTVMAHMDWYSGDREYELRVLPGHSVEVISITDEAGRAYDVTGVRFVA